jgi:ABC-2 type transport system permease protein
VSPVLAQVGWVARRSVRRSLRQPAVIVPTIVFPLILLAVNAAGLDEATRIPGFPADSYLDFAIAICFMQAALFATTAAGTELAHDVETGFLSRLSLTPMRGVAVLLGQLAGAVTVGMLGGAIYLAVGLAAGVEVQSGAGGVLVLLALTLVICVGFAAIGLFMALRTGSGEAVQGAFPLLFVVFFLSSMSMPRELIEVDWFRTVATWNPMSYMVEGLRSLVIDGWDATALWRGFATAGAIVVVGFAAAGSSLRTRMERT